MKIRGSLRIVAKMIQVANDFGEITWLSVPAEEEILSLIMRRGL